MGRKEKNKSDGKVERKSNNGKKAVLIFVCAAVVLVAGTAVAYYNTETFGFDENAEIASRDGEKITFLDYEIYYEDVDRFFKNVREHMPEKPYAVQTETHYNVVRKQVG